MERLLAVELQAQGHLRSSAENTPPDGFCRAWGFTTFFIDALRLAAGFR